MASIRKRGDTYYITVSLGRDKHDRKLIETYTYKPEATTPKAQEKEVNAFAADFEKRVKAGHFLDGEKITFSDFVNDWSADWLERNVTQGTIESYTDIINRRAIPLIGHYRISKISALHIQKIINGMEDQGLKSGTIRRAMAAINSVFSYAYRMNVIRENPCTRCELPKEAKDNALHYFTVDQAKRFLAAIGKPYTHAYKAHKRNIGNTLYDVSGYQVVRIAEKQFQALFELLIFGGIRRGEVVALQWRDIDFEKRTISIVRAAAKVKGGQIIKEPKTPSSIRKIVLPKSVITTLKEWKAAQQEHCMLIGTQWEGKRGDQYDENFVFIQMENGLMMHVDTPTHKFYEIIDLYNRDCENEADKLPRIRLHDLRHTSATLLIADGVDIETISHRLGHSRASVTLDVYGHWTNEGDEKAADALDRLFAI